MDLQRQQAVAVEGLERLATAAIVVDEAERILFANQPGLDLIRAADGIVVDHQGRLTSSGTLTEKQQLSQLIQAASATSAGKGRHAGGLLAISRRASRQPLPLLIAPFRAVGRFPGELWAAAVVFATDPAKRHGPVPRRLQEIYQLTGAEARVAVALSEGLSVAAIAERDSVSVATVRQQLKMVLSKTDTHRQSELIHLILTGPAAL